MSVRNVVSSAHIDQATGYYQLEKDVTMRTTLAGNTPLFTTDANCLWEAYLNGIFPLYRQHYNCNACRRFIERYGGLVTIDPATGTVEPLLWKTEGKNVFQPSQEALYNMVSGARVTGVFYSSDLEWGTPITGQWTHLAGVNPKPFKHALLTAAQAMAERKEDYAILRRSLAEYSQAAAVQAVRVLEADVVDRSEKALEIAKWFLDLHNRLATTRNQRCRDNLCWLATANAPAGWCHIKTQMVGTLLDDVVQGLDFDAIKRRWNEKMHPLQYQRPSSISEGNLEQANKLVEKLGSAGALDRRYAKLTDVLQFKWKPSPLQPAEAVRQGGPFDHLRGKRQAEVKEVSLPTQKITWDKFCTTVLPTTVEMHYLVPMGNASFYGLVTAVNADAPPLLQWDTEQARNPVSWYFRYGGSYANEWGLTALSWVKVNGVFYHPPKWTMPEASHFPLQVFFALEGCQEQQHTRGGGFFPECMKAEYHSIRKAMELYDRNRTITGNKESDACGICLAKNSPVQVRVKTANGASQEYLVSLE